MTQMLIDRRLGGLELAYMVDGGKDEIGRCGFMFLGGFKSDMTGKKAEALADLARSTRRRGLRFDYSGHGQSSGEFRDRTVSDWLEESLHMFLAHTRSKMVIVGSSMGGWLALLLARRLKEEDPAAFRRVAGLVLIAPAADMTQDLMWKTFGEPIRNELRMTGMYLQPSQYGEPYEITSKLLSDGLKHQILEATLNLPFPVRILQGTHDVEVPPAHAVKTMDALTGPDITLTLIKGGDHRLSTSIQLKFICETVISLAERADGAGF